MKKVVQTLFNVKRHNNGYISLDPFGSANAHVFYCK